MDAQPPDVEAPVEVSWTAGAGTGLLGGIASGLLGIGGGLVTVPILSTALGVPLKRAIGSSLPAVVATALVAVATEALVARSNLAWREAALLAIGALAGAWLGARIVAASRARSIAFLMAAVLLLVALRMSGLLHGLLPAGSGAPLAGVVAVVAHVAVGVVAGISSALFGVGGGIVAVPALAVLHPAWAFQACRATSLAMIVPTAIAGSLMHRRLGHVDTRLVARLVPGSLVGAVLGVLLANRVASRPLEIAFAALMVISAIRVARSAR
jgi:uncharacterized membrane protein YfcA